MLTEHLRQWIPWKQITQLEADLLELASLTEKAERKRVQELLKQEQTMVEKELATKRQQKEQQARRQADSVASSKAVYTVKITNYGTPLCKALLVLFLFNYNLHGCAFFQSNAAWDQSEKFVKIYLTLKNVHKIPSEKVEVKFSERYAVKDTSMYKGLHGLQC